jgi:hypothetical protein
LNQLIDSYYSSVFNSVVRLTGHSDEKELKALTEKVLAELEQRKSELAAAERKGVFVYRVVLVHVFDHLQATGNVQRMEFLRKILLIHPSHYLRLPD